jgi:energy-coupling factor transporter transmembrane protein EcfT
MRILIALLLVIISVITGFLFASLLGAILFGVLLTGAIYVAKKKNFQQFSIFVTVVCIFSIVGFLLMMAFGLLHANSNVQGIVKNLRSDLRKEGYNPNWVIISQKRYVFFNDLINNSVKKSKHLEGKAIDLFIIDINGNGVYDQNDFQLIQNSLERIKETNSSIKIRVYDYFGKGLLTQHMVHIEVD